MNYQENPKFKILSTCKGGGYMYARTEPMHPKANSNGLYPLHRVLVENRINRLLCYGEEVHHKNENKMDNNPDNLEVMLKGKHTALHNKKSKILCICPMCGNEFELTPCKYRLRLKRSKFGILFCSYSCGAKHQYNHGISGLIPDFDKGCIQDLTG